MVEVNDDKTVKKWQHFWKKWIFEQFEKNSGESK
jgi:hypothetical protein